MLPVTELINYFSGRLQEHPPLPEHSWKDICRSTIAYLNSYRRLQDMLDELLVKTKSG